MRAFAPAAVAALLVARSGAAGASADDRSEPPPWRLTATALAYVVPDQPDFVMALVPVDVGGRLHVEARYNYEAVRSASAFVGANATWGDRLKLSLTPMLGGVIGEVRGVVPALRLTLAWWKLDLYSESETVLDLGDPASSFFYEWSELGFSPLAWLRFGVVVQRSRVLRTPLDVQRGLFAGFTIRRATLTVYELNAGWTTPTWVGAVSVSF